MPDVLHQFPANYVDRPEVSFELGTGLDQFLSRILGYVQRPYVVKSICRTNQLQLIEDLSIKFKGQPLDVLQAEAAELSSKLRRKGFDPYLVAYGFSLVREISELTLNMRHYDCQLLGGLALLQGAITEMSTGEGKTLTATLPASIAAIGGVPVHVITSNDYLASRDAELMRPLYSALGLSVGLVVGDTKPDERRAAYACDVTYCSNKEIVFDYLRDQLFLKGRNRGVELHADHLCGETETIDKLLLRGLHFAIVDEADSVMIDQARTPLVISRPGKGNQEEVSVLQQALSIAHDFTEGLHFKIDHKHSRPTMSDEGLLHLEAHAKNLGFFWNGQHRARGLVEKALTALHIFHLDKDYLIRDDKIQIVDEYTGRAMKHRSWDRGLHCLVELKEGCSVTRPRETLGKISFQSFFRKYQHLSGMTATAKEVETELWDVYKKCVVSVPPNWPSRLVHLENRMFDTEDEKEVAVLERVTEVIHSGRSALIGTNSVAESEIVSQSLTDAGIAHEVLNAKQDEKEAELISQAGLPGRVTVATRMAGRGVDILLDPGVEAMGGLHVISAEFADVSRIDRQLKGRCARQGVMGSYESFASLEDAMLTNHKAGFVSRLATSSVAKKLKIHLQLGMLALHWLQWRREKSQAIIRRKLLSKDVKKDRLMSFAGQDF